LWVCYSRFLQRENATSRLDERVGMAEVSNPYRGTRLVNWFASVASVTSHCTIPLTSRLLEREGEGR
jgi:hypothetical protein